MTASESAVQARDPGSEWRRWLLAVGVLTGAVLVVLAVDCAVIAEKRGRDGAIAAALAAAVCWMASLLALVVTLGLAKGPQLMVGALGGIVFRTGMPLAALAVGNQVRWLSENGFPGQVVVFFLATLTVETILATWLASRMLNVKLWDLGAGG
ncbi:MAG: hypothetical protein KF774_11605 [Planctomyces sp.]|nr:hypothetical protein [Planctomyces sp.]